MQNLQIDRAVYRELVKIRKRQREEMIRGETWAANRDAVCAAISVFVFGVMFVFVLASFAVLGFL